MASGTFTSEISCYIVRTNTFMTYFIVHCLELWITTTTWYMVSRVECQYDCSVFCHKRELTPANKYRTDIIERMQETLAWSVIYRVNGQSDITTTISHNDLHEFPKQSQTLTATHVFTWNSGRGILANKVKWLTSQTLTRVTKPVTTNVLVKR